MLILSKVLSSTVFTSKDCELAACASAAAAAASSHRLQLVTSSPSPPSSTALRICKHVLPTTLAPCGEVESANLILKQRPLSFWPMVMYE